MKKIAVIGGSGVYEFPEMENQRSLSVDTPYAKNQLSVTSGEIGGNTVVFLPRHGVRHQIPPHKINYRANIHALSELGVTHIIAVNAVGGISAHTPPGSYVVPNQIIDYTWAREHTFFDGFGDGLGYIEFGQPFDQALREVLLQVLAKRGEVYSGSGVYGCTQGPRLETAAEIAKLRSDGCDLVGMTLMPEAALAREKQIRYASLCVVVNWAAGVADVEVSIDDIKRLLAESMQKVRHMLKETVSLL